MQGVRESGDTHTPTPQDSSFEEEEEEMSAVSALESPADTCLSHGVFPRAATPTDNGAVSPHLVCGGMGGPGIGSGIYTFGREEAEGLEGGMRMSTGLGGAVLGGSVGLGSQWSLPQSPSEFFSWSNGEYCT